MPSNTATLLALLMLSSACSRASAPATSATKEPPLEDISFISVVVDKDTNDADTRLKRFLEGVITAKAVKSGSSQHAARFPQQTMTYGEVIRAFAERDASRAYVARITPYAYVAAEMLGAKLDILGIYRSVSTKSMTYHSYFVVPKEKFGQVANRREDSGEATLDELAKYLKALKAKPKFIYHDRFSTSSYFLPSLNFKQHHVFATSQPINNEEIIPIQVSRFPSTSSSDLVRQVAKGEADLAAVWDGTMKKFTSAVTADDDAAVNKVVQFIQIPTELPNDFLVASGVSESTRAMIVEGIKANPAAGRPCTDVPADPLAASAASRPSCDDYAKKGLTRRPKDDFDAWYAWETSDSEVSDAPREALARLRDAARQAPAPVVVKVVAGEPKPGGDRVPVEYVEAAKLAVRLSGTEFVLYDEDLHKRVDVTWTLESTHDGALTLTSTLQTTLDKAFDRTEVPFDRSESASISFNDKNDLPQRIADLARTRLRRIRYVWPYEEKYPAVLRDLDFTPDRRVLVQQITWLDPNRNDYAEDTPFFATIDDNTDFSKFRLSDHIKFPRNADGSLGFDPMSNVAYRVIVSRQPRPGWIWLVLPYCFIALLALASVGFILDLRRQQPPPKGLQQTYQRMVEAYHDPWRGREVEEGQILWSDPKYIDEFVKEIKTTGSILDEVRTGGFDFNFGPIPVRFSLLMRLWERLFTRRYQVAGELLEAAAAGSVGTLDMLLQYLVCRRRLSPFVGFPESVSANGGSRPPASPMEWEALNAIVSRHFYQIGTSRKEIDATLGPQNGTLGAVVSNHFRRVIKKATHTASFFCQTWTVGAKDAPDRLVYEQEMYSPLVLGTEHGSVGRVRLNVMMPPAAVLRDVSGAPELNAWVLGKVITWSAEQGTLAVEVRPMAVLRGHDPEE